MISAEQSIYLNQLANGVVPLEEGERWFAAQELERQREILLGLTGFVQQSHPTPSEGLEAIQASRLKPTLTPCVLLRNKDFKMGYSKIRLLPESELVPGFRLLVVLLGIADARRKKNCPENCSHWWHRDLSDPKEVRRVRRKLG